MLLNSINKSILGIFFLLMVLAVVSFAAKITDSSRRPEEEIVPLAKLEDGLEPDISAYSVAVVRQETGQVLYSKNSEARLPIASITKLMTAVLFSEKIGPLELIAISSDAKKAVEWDENISPVSAGEIFKAEDILKMALIESQNDIARSAAEAVVVRESVDTAVKSFAEKMDFFTGLMNKKRDELGMKDTMFNNPVGLDSISNYSTVGDLSRLAKFISEKEPRIWEITRLAETDIFSKSGNKYHLVTTNPLLVELPGEIIGTKTGSTDGAKLSLLFIANIKKDDPIIFVILRSEDRIKDAKNLIAWTRLTYGF